MTILRVFGPFAVGYFFSYVFRTVNALIAPDLAADVGIGAADLGLLTSAYLLTFAAVQIPLGVTLDRFGPRRTVAVLLLLAGVGAAVFATSHSLAGLVIGRALIGLGVSACLIGALTAYRLWFPRERMVLAHGCHLAFGGLGAIAVTVPTQWALAYIDWRGLFALAAVAIVAVAVLIMVVVPREPARGDAAGAPASDAGWSGYGQVFRSPLFWRVVPLTMATQASFLAIQGLWLGPWLSDVAGLARPQVADHLFWVAAAMTAGMLGSGWAVERLARVGVRPLNAIVPIGAVLMLIQAGNVFHLFRPELPGWVLFGLLGNTGTLVFSALAQEFPKALVGRVVSALNLLCVLAAWAAQWGVGAVIGLWPALPSGAYPEPAYVAGFGMMLALHALGLAWYLGFRPARPRALTMAGG